MVGIELGSWAPNRLCNDTDGFGDSVPDNYAYYNYANKKWILIWHSRVKALPNFNTLPIFSQLYSDW